MTEPRDPETSAQLYFLEVVDELGVAGLEEILIRSQLPQAVGRSAMAGKGEVQLWSTYTGIDFTIGKRGPYSVTFAEAERLIGLDEPR